ncbi:SDR family NAD(P)-dependent oxidoreductase [Shewanella sp. WXL01]|uniref:SDR family NAD(P)-dependent oxidoreductase n=1 Tax=Shewanella maritima TaxID=2520507 RepID=A0A411PJ54_9GAMM|nr:MULTISPECIES: SDR family NAD(P)-dependent oxidoreductase [Shewanella]NKF51189.1 SDR family NAD(P)-dependent oxidoreductase [Shewanella sp. WXL01]QBF83514.1 SDR family NAD(P)-dependent oxidoreductase [Shewanella maritima]
MDNLAPKTILLTGATDGIGFEAAKQFAQQGHHLLVHGRSPEKVEKVINQLSCINSNAKFTPIIADLSSMTAVENMISDVKQHVKQLDVLINNAGIFKTPNPVTDEGLDIRFVVNTLAPYRLTMQLLPLMNTNSRVVNLSSAAQASVDYDALAGSKRLGDNPAYAQSKLAITMWTSALAKQYKGKGPMMVSVNPKSLLASKMVKEAYGIQGSDISVGGDIIVRAALSDEFADAHGKYYDNDIEAFAPPHSDATDMAKNERLVEVIERFYS